MHNNPTAMIVTAQPEASEAGARVLMRGGPDGALQTRHLAPERTG